MIYSIYCICGESVGMTLICGFKNLVKIIPENELLQEAALRNWISAKCKKRWHTTSAIITNFPRQTTKKETFFTPVFSELSKRDLEKLLVIRNSFRKKSFTKYDQVATCANSWLTASSLWKTVDRQYFWRLGSWTPKLRVRCHWDVLKLEHVENGNTIKINTGDESKKTEKWMASAPGALGTWTKEQLKAYKKFFFKTVGAIEINRIVRLINKVTQRIVRFWKQYRQNGFRPCVASKKKIVTKKI